MRDPHKREGRSRQRRNHIDFNGINRAALPILGHLLRRWLSGGKLCGDEYVVLNPRRPDNKPGSFKINVNTGAWADFAVGAMGGDPISLAAYLFNTTQSEAARTLAQSLGVPFRMQS